jgi:hypothetical protein
MDDPRPLSDDPDGSPLARALLASARTDAPSPDARARAARRLGIAAVLAFGAGTGTEAGALVVAGKLAAVLVALGGVVGLAMWQSPASAPRTPAGFDRRSQIAVGGDPDGSAGGAGGKAPRGIELRSQIAVGGDPDGSAGGAGGKDVGGIDRRSQIAVGGAVADPPVPSSAVSGVASAADPSPVSTPPARIRPGRRAHAPQTSPQVASPRAPGAEPAAAPPPDDAAVAAGAVVPEVTASGVTPRSSGVTPRPGPVAEITAPPPPVAEITAPPPVGPGRLAVQVALVDRARARLGAGDYLAARAALDEYHQRFPDGDLDAEADMVMIEILIAQREVDRARTLGTAFLSRFPRSPLGQRVRSLLDRLPK